MNYSIYELLYKFGGYHAGTRDTHGIPLIQKIQKLPQIHSILDVGCSHGDVVKRYWDRGYLSSGMDVSHTAVKRAYETRGNKSDFCISQCFRQASATNIPWDSKSFDAIVSSDVLEHINIIDIPLVLSEFKRVSRKYILLLIAKREEINKAPILFLKKKGINVNALHVTVQNKGWWRDQFQKVGFEIKEYNNILGAHSFVLNNKN